MDELSSIDVMGNNLRDAFHRTGLYEIVDPTISRSSIHFMGRVEKTREVDWSHGLVKELNKHFFKRSDVAVFTGKQFFVREREEGNLQFVHGWIVAFSGSGLLKAEDEILGIISEYYPAVEVEEQVILGTVPVYSADRDKKGARAVGG